MSGFFNFAIGVLTLVGFYAIIAMILNLEAGWAGLWDLGLAGLLGAGGYFYVLTTLEPEGAEVTFAGGWPIWAGMLGAGVFTALLALLIGIPALRLRGEYFLITTFAFAEMIRQFLINESAITNGTVGFTEFDRPFQDLVSPTSYEYVLLGIVAVAVGLTYLLMRRLARSPYGRLLRGCRDNEALALALGKNATRQRVVVFVFAGFLLGLAAPLYVWHIRAIVPSMYGPDITFTAWTALVVGGIGSIRGGIVGALVLVGFTQALLFVPVSIEYQDLLSAMPPLLLGLALIVVLRLRPDGLMSERGAFRVQEGRASGPLGRRVAALVGSGSEVEGGKA
jgi:branched-chain amino acid transport system permease protein